MNLIERRRQMMMSNSSPTPPFPQDAYLTFVAKTANSSVSVQKTGTPAAVSLEYSLDGGTWNTYAVGDIISLTNVGSWVKFKGVNAAFGTSTAWNQFVMDGEIDAYGDLTSILNGVGGDYTPRELRAFINLFRNCTSLRRAPDLPTTTLGNRQYYHMFEGCTNLNYIKTSMTNISANQCLQGWVTDVGSNGTFVCPSSLSIGTSVSGIPSGWTRVNLVNS